VVTAKGPWLKVEKPPGSVHAEGAKGKPVELVEGWPPDLWVGPPFAGGAWLSRAGQKGCLACHQIKTWPTD